MDPVAHGIYHPHNLVNGFPPSANTRHGTIPAVEDTAARNRDICLVRTVETGLKQISGNEIIIQVEICNPAATVGNLNRTERVNCQPDAVAPHGKENCPFGPGTRPCCGPGNEPPGRFTGEVYGSCFQEPAFQFCPVHNSSASS
jgi:hypothetical protein